MQHSNLGWVLAEANGQVVYTYGGDSKGGSPTCTGSCAAIWPAVTGLPMASPADTLPGQLGTVSMSNGAKQITYNGMPLYTFKGAKPLSTKGNGVEGKWHVIKLPGSAVTSVWLTPGKTPWDPDTGSPVRRDTLCARAGGR